MSERTTGATPAQITAGFGRYYRWFERNRIALTVGSCAEVLVPPDHRIFGPDDVAALRRVLDDWGTSPSESTATSADANRLAALIGDGK